MKRLIAVLLAALCLAAPARAQVSGTMNAVQQTTGSSCSATMQGNSTAGTVTYTVQSCTWTVIGRQVFMQWAIQWSGVTGMTGVLVFTFTGGPPAPANVANDIGMCAPSLFSGITLSAGNTTLFGRPIGGTGQGQVLQSGSGTVSGTIDAATVPNGAGILQMNCFWHT